MKIPKIALTALAGLVGWAALAQGKPLKVLLVYDMEGVTGAKSPGYCFFDDSTEYRAARESLTEDVNAAVRGLVASGATDVVVVDGHGSGNSQEPDVLVDRLLAPARMIERDYPVDPYMDGLDQSVDAVVAVAMHAGAGNESGFMRHTLTLEAASYRVSGIPFNECMILAASAARFKVPLVMASGDDQLQKELERQLPWVRYAPVKRAVNRREAEPVDRAEASRRIEAAAKEGLLNRAAAKLPDWQAPYRFVIRFQDEDQAGIAALLPGGALQADGTSVEYKAHDFEEGYRAVRQMLKKASVATWSAAGEAVIEAQPNAEQLRAQVLQWAVDRWLGDKPEATPAQEPKKKYWGAR